MIYISLGKTSEKFVKSVEKHPKRQHDLNELSFIKSYSAIFCVMYVLV